MLGPLRDDGSLRARILNVITGVLTLIHMSFRYPKLVWFLLNYRPDDLRKIALGRLHIHVHDSYFL
jgi:hypothetical protein